MPEYKVTCICGHTDLVEIGRRCIRPREILKLRAKNLCRECQAAGSDLSGSTNSVCWAEEIRAEKLAEWDDVYARVLKDQASSDSIPAMLPELIRSAFELIRSEKRASWWIDSQYDSLTSLLVSRSRDLLELCSSDMLSTDAGAEHRSAQQGGKNGV